MVSGRVFYVNGKLDTDGNPVFSGYTAAQAMAARDRLADALDAWWLTQSTVLYGPPPDTAGYGERVDYPVADGETDPIKFAVFLCDPPNDPPAQVYVEPGHLAVPMGVAEEVSGSDWRTIPS